MSADNGHAQDATPTPARPRWQVVITMDEQLRAQVAHNCPSGDVVEMLVYRGLKYIERELQAGRLFRVEEPRVSIANSFPKGV